MPADQLRADLFELGQLGRATGLDPERVAAHVAMIRGDAAALLDDPDCGTLAAEVVKACDSLELREAISASAPERSLPDPVEVEVEVEPPPRLAIGLTGDDQRWVWRFPEDVERLREEWREGYLPVHLTPGAPAHRGILGEVRSVDTLPEVDLHATLSADACTLHLPDGDLVWRMRVDVALVRDGAHLATWRFPGQASLLREEWRAGRAPLQGMPLPRAYAKEHLGEVGPATGHEAATILLAPGHETRLVLDGQEHPLEAELDLADLWHFQALGPALYAREPRPSFFSPGERPLRRDAVGLEKDRLERLAARTLTAAELAGAKLDQVRELVLGSPDPGVEAALIAGTRAAHLRRLVLLVDAPALVAHASRLTCLELVGVPAPALPATLRELHVEGPLDAPALAAKLHGCPHLERLVLRRHGLDHAGLASLSGRWDLDAGAVDGQDVGLDQELAGLRPDFDVLDPIVDRWIHTLRGHLQGLVAAQGHALSWPADAPSATGAAALRRIPATGALSALLKEAAAALDRVRAGREGDYGNDLAAWLRPLSAVAVRCAGLAGDGGERARQLAEIARLE